MVAKSAEDIRGTEFDWLAVDGDGHVALFSTAGAGYAPPEFLRDTDAHDAALEDILALPTSTRARFAPQIAPGLKNTWLLVAERGLFAFDSDPNGGPYRLVAAPQLPIRVTGLPNSIANTVRQVGFLHLRFTEVDNVSEEKLKETA
jgi:hypothetical protein